MKRTTMIALVALAPGIDAGDARAESAVRFRPLDLMVDTRGIELGAWQIEIRVDAGDGRIVGVEGGEHAAYSEPPYYDARALMSGRIILAAFSTAKDLPVGRTRVATLHMRETGGTVRYSVHVVAAGDASAERIEITASLEDRPYPQETP